jgi:hypothetical protein
MDQDMAEKIEKLNRKRAELEECNRNIERIRAELAQAKIRQARQRQLAAVAKAPHNNIGLPREILYQIFTYHVRETSMGLRTLSMVCKGWKEIIEDTSDESKMLWTMIRVAIPPEVSRINSCIAYCQKAIEKSGQEVVDISLDYTPASRVPWDRILYEHVLESLKKLCDDSEYHEKLYAWLPKACRRGDNEQFRLHYSTHFLKPLATLAGEKGCWINRWRSFELQGEQSYLSLFRMRDIGPYLKDNAPNLESIKITNKGRFVTVWENKDWFQQLPNLKHLSLTYLHVPIAPIPISPKKLETLKLPWFSDYKDLAVILDCTNLRSLAFSIKHGLEEEEKSIDFEKEYNFPHLQELHVRGSVPQKFWKAVRLPVLKQLTFGDRRVSTSFVANQNIVLPQVEKVAFGGPLAKEPITVKEALGAVVRSCPNLVTLRVLQKYAKETVDVLGELRSEGVASDSLKDLELQTRRNSDEVRTELIAQTIT